MGPRRLRSQCGDRRHDECGGEDAGGDSVERIDDDVIECVQYDDIDDRVFIDVDVDYCEHHLDDDDDDDDDICGQCDETLVAAVHCART